MRTSLEKNGIWLTAWGALVLTALLTRPPLPVDETRYLSVAWEMWQQQHILVPISNGAPYSHKPPLLFWLMQASWLPFGVHGFTARLIAPLFGLGSIWLSMRLAAKLWPERPVLPSRVPFLLLGMPVWTVYASLTMFDTLVAFFSLLGWLALINAAQTNRPAWWWVFGLAIGLGLLSKGPVALVFLLWPALLAPWWLRSWPHSWWSWYIRVFAALMLGTVIILAWAIPAALAGGSDYARALFWGQTAGRIHNSFAHQHPVYWYALLLPVLLLPWSLYPGWYRGTGTMLTESRSRFCASIVLPAFITLSLVSGKQLHYLLPLFPVVAILLARIAQECEVSQMLNRWLPAVVLAVLAVLCLLIPRYDWTGAEMAIIQNMAPWTGAVLFICSVGIFFLLSKELVAPLPATSLSFIALVIILHFSLAGACRTFLDTSIIASALTRAEEEHHPVAVLPDRFADQFQFAARLQARITPLSGEQKLLQWQQDNPRNYVLFFARTPPVQLIDQATSVQVYQNGYLLLAPARVVKALACK